MKSLRATIITVADEIREDRTITLRQLYYALTVRGVLAKTETDYKRLAQISAAMRRAGEMPYSWIEDGTRITYLPNTWSSARDALESLAEQYQESPWPDAAVVPEIWLEKDALAGVVYDVTYKYCVPLRVQRGYASLSALHKASRAIVARMTRGTRTKIYYLRDLDPSGADAARAAEATVFEMIGDMEDAPRRMSGRCEYPPEFCILGVTPEQVKQWKLPTRPNKASDTRSAAFEHTVSVELDAITPNQLRKLVTDAIASHMPESALLAHEAQIESTRAYLQGLAVAA